MHYAHVSEDGKRKQTLIEHLEGTAKLAGEFADAFGGKEWGEDCGKKHDIGKYSGAFQHRLLDNGPKVDHSTAGAVEAKKDNNMPAAYCIAGHHAGLPDGGAPGDSSGPTLCGRLKKKLPDYHEFKNEIQFTAPSTFPVKPLDKKAGFSFAFFTRMLYSCLVDADFLDTERFMLDKNVRENNSESMQILLKKLGQFVQDWMKCKDAETINGHRTQILKACFEKGKEDKGLYRLTVPTGGGKTIASLAFALQHAVEHKLDHVIYVIPYTSIIEQTADIFRKILGSENILEDQSNVVYNSNEEMKKCQLASENWDRPVIVTTNVQFFESLFSNKSSKCRKLHTMANSVIIFDEAQMLPTIYLKPCIQAISELVFNYRSSAVLCTATQPALDHLFPSEIRAKEICPDIQSQYQFFKRVQIENIGEISESELIGSIVETKQVLCILNSRKRVQDIYQKLTEQNVEGIYHLSTMMYPKHRRRILAEIRKRLAEDKDCKVIATSLVEAGVDLDFAEVYRELSGIDSVIQAAGRCNREGKRNVSEAVTKVFTLDNSEQYRIPFELKLPVEAAKLIVSEYEDISSLEAIESYFRRLYDYRGEGLDQKKIIQDFENGARNRLFPFASVAEKFRIIENKTVSVLITKEERAVQIKEELKLGMHSKQLLREAGQYMVNVYENDFSTLYGTGDLEAIDSEIWVLRNNENYCEETGLNVKAQTALFG